MMIHCNLWGDIPISRLAQQCIDTTIFQRLHYISQNGLAYKVFPSARGSRFEHSIGTYHTVKLMFQCLHENSPECVGKIDQRQQELVAIAGLCHDLGHGPFSHAFDTHVSEKVSGSRWMHHETRSTALFRAMHENHDLLSQEEIDFVCECIHPSDPNAKTWVYTLVSNRETGIDADKIDYLLRDSMNFGLPFRFDPWRILRSMRVTNDTIVYRSRVQDEIFALFLVRNRLYQLIYYHRRVREFETCIFQELWKHNSEEFVDVLRSENVEVFCQWTEGSFLERIPVNTRNDIMIRKTRSPLEKKVFEDHQFHKIRHVPFYHKQDPETISYLEFPDHGSSLFQTFI